MYGDLTMKKLAIAILAVLPLTVVEAGNNKDNVFTGSWETVGSLLEGREGACMGRVDNRLVMTHGLVLGVGDSGHVRVYDTKTDLWSSTGTSSPNVRSEGVGVAYMGDVYCIGGREAGVLSLVERYRLSDDSWLTMVPMDIARGGPAADIFEYNTGALDDLDNPIFDPKIYVFGGRTGGIPFSGAVLDSAEVYDIKTDAWSVITPPPTPVSDARAVTKGGKIFLTGGAVDSPQVSSNLLQIYDPQTDSWTVGMIMPTLRANHAAAYIGNTIYVIGGADGLVRLDTVDAYDVDKGTWTTGLTIKPNSSNETHAVRVGNKLYVPGSGIFGTAESFFDVFSRK